MRSYSGIVAFVLIWFLAVPAAADPVRLYPWDLRNLETPTSLWISADVVIGDVTGDGRKDVVATSYRSRGTRNARLYVFAQRPNGGVRMAQRMNLDGRGRVLGLDLADIDDDGDLDAAVALNEGVQILEQKRRGLRRGRLVSPFKNQERTFITFLKFGHMNSDRRIDLVVALDRRALVLYQTRKQGFRKGPVLRNTRGPIEDLEIGNVAGGPRRDVVVRSRRYCYPILYRQRGDGEFSRKRLPGCNLAGITVGDVTQDGRPDIVATDGAQVRLYRRTSEGLRLTKRRTDQQLMAVEVADISGDGRNEIVALGGGSSMRVFRASGKGSLRQVKSVLSRTGSTGVDALAAGDVDGDRRADVVFAPGYNALNIHRTRVPRCFGKKANIVGSAGDNEIRGTRGADVIWTGKGDDVIRARGGRDVICAGSGNDAVETSASDAKVALGAGADLLQMSAGDDVIRGGSGSDTVDASSGSVNRGISIDLSRGIARGWGRDRLASIEHAIGTDRDDVLVGSPRANSLDGRDGNDLLDGRGGDDVLRPFGGDDSVIGGDGVDTVTFDDFFAASDAVPVIVDLEEGTSTGRGQDSLDSVENVIGSAADDVIGGDGGNNALYGLGGDDAISARGGNDVVGPGFGDDQLDGGEGRDVLDYSFGDYEGHFDVGIDLTAGVSQYEGGRGDDTHRGFEDVIGSFGVNEIVGNDGPNHLVGLDGNDHIEGRGGDDLLDGGSGTDRLDGGVGVDVCVNGEDVIDCEETSASASPTFERFLRSVELRSHLDWFKTR